MSISQKWANDQVLRYSSDATARRCEYFGCQVGNLLEYLPPPAAAKTKEKH